MQEKLIEFKTAKLAKEKGFKNGSISYYAGNSKLITFNTNLYPNALYTNNTAQKFTYEATTQSLLQRWIREVHKISVEVALDFMEDKYGDTLYYHCNILHSIDSHKTVKWLGAECTYENYNTWEEALEAGLMEGLKLIK